MKINYLKRKSKFIDKIADIIIQKKTDLLNGNTILIQFSPEGYKGDIKVTIDKNDKYQFKTDWSQTDSTRFPQRIKVAAHALFNQECYGDFLISHDSGKLSIKRLS